MENYKLRSLHGMLISQTIPVTFLSDVLEGVGAESALAKKLLAEFDLNPERLKLSGHRLSVLEYTAFIRRVMKTTDDLFLHFLDHSIPRKAFGVFAMGAVGCRSLQSLVDYGNRFFSLFTDRFSWRLEMSDKTVALVLNFEETRAISYRFIYQSMLIIWFRLISWFVGMELKPHCVEFRFDEQPNDRQHMRYLFSENLVFSSADNRLVFERESVDVPFTATEEEVHRMLKDNHSMMLVRTHTEPWTRQTRHLLVMHRQKGWLPQKELARHFGVSENLYWRKLKGEGTTYNEVLANLKRDLALRLLSDPALAIREVADTLHFSEISAFDKAFKKWTGTTPGLYRQQLAQ